MSRCRRESNPDLICTSYKTASNRSIRLLLLEIVAEAWLKDHQELKNFTAGFGPKQDCNCPICDKAREAMRLKHDRG